jgi:hypothetical protein
VSQTSGSLVYSGGQTTRSPSSSPATTEPRRRLIISERHGASDATGKPSAWCAIAAATAFNLPIGSLYAFSVFLRPLEALLGVTRADLALVFALAAAGFGAGMNLGPYLYGLAPASVLLLACGAASTVGIALASSANGLAQLAIGYGVLFGGGGGAGYIIAQQTVNLSVTSRHGLVNGYLVGLYPAGAMIAAPLFGWGVRELGVRATLAGLAVSLAVAGVASAWLIAHSGVALRASTAAVELAEHERRRPVFWRLWLLFFFAASAGLMVLSQAAGIIAAYGGATALAVYGTTFITVSIAAARLGGGWMVDWLAIPTVSAGAHAIALAGNLALTLWPGPAVSVLALTLVGLGYGVISGVTAAAVAAYWRRALYGRVASRLYTAWCAAAIVLPIAAGRLFDLTHGYRAAVLIAAGGNLLGILVALGLPRQRDPRSEAQAPEVEREPAAPAAVGSSNSFAVVSRPARAFVLLAVALGLGWSIPAGARAETPSSDPAGSEEQVRPTPLPPPPISFRTRQRLRNRPDLLQRLLEPRDVGPPRAASAPSTTSPWRALANPPTFSPGAMLLLTDGTVMVNDQGQFNNGGSGWWRFTPDISGSYVNGTWSKLASMPAGYAPIFFASAVLPDGRVIVEGGEYNNGAFADTRLGAIYDPLADSWASVPPSNQFGIGDAPSIVLADGTFMLGSCCSAAQALLNPSTLTWSTTGFDKLDSSSESSWSLLPDGSVLTVDAFYPVGTCGTNSERYLPETGSWVSAGSTIVHLSDCLGPDALDEIGPQIVRPDGTTIVFGGTNTGVAHTAIYDSATGTWSVGPDLPTIKGVSYTMADAPAAALPSGNVLFAASPPFFGPPVHFFVFDGTSITQIADTANASGLASFTVFMLVLPTGQVLVNSRAGDIEIYDDPGSPDPAWAPVITSVPAALSPGVTYQLFGEQLSGLSQGAAYGDDYQSATNYPLVRIVNAASGHVFYGRTFDHSYVGVGPGTPSFTNFTVPAAGSIEMGPSHLFVVANGIASAPVAVTIAETAKSDQTIHVTAPPPSSASFGASFSVTATTSTGLPVAITTTGGCAGGGAGSASVTMTSGVTPCVVHYNQAGDVDYDPAPPKWSATTAIRSAQVITVTKAAPSAAFLNAAFGVAATASSGGPVAITTTDGCTGSGTGTATITMTSPTAACVVLYDQSGNGNYAAAPEVTSTTTATGAPTLKAAASPLPDGQIGMSYAQPLVTGGAPPYTLAVTKGSLPPGLALSAHGALSGMPSKSKFLAFSFTIHVTDQLNATLTAAFKLKIDKNRGSALRQRREHASRQRGQRWVARAHDEHRVARARGAEDPLDHGGVIGRVAAVKLRREIGREHLARHVAGDGAPRVEDLRVAEAVLRAKKPRDELS